MDNLTIIIPFWNGQKTIARLLKSIPDGIPVIVVDDHSDKPYQPKPMPGLTVIRPETKGYFTGAVNSGMAACSTDVLILNQDAEFTSSEWMKVISDNRKSYAMIGERILGNHPSWPAGYIHGTFMFMRRDAINQVGPMNAIDYPLWGSTCEYQLRFARAGYKIHMLQHVPGFEHERAGRYGEAITEMLRREPESKNQFLHTPPEISVIIPCFNHGRFLQDAINSLIGGPTTLGDAKPQSFQSFDIWIVDDGSTDNTAEIAQKLADPLKGIRYVRQENGGTASAINTGIASSRGRFVTVLGADDMMESWRLELLYRHAQADPTKVYYDDAQRFDARGKLPSKALGGYDFERLIYQNNMHAGIFFARTAWQKVGGYPHMPEGREDWAMNVRLGVHGYCGYYVNRPGYLYRRHDNNRTLKNTTTAWRAKFLAQIQALYPEIYHGKRPAMCCGAKRVGAGNQSAKIGTERIVPMSGGSVVLEYLGTSTGSQTFYGPATGARYSAGKNRPLVAVDPRDLQTDGAKPTGLLQLSEGGKRLFRQHSTPAPKAAKVSELVALALAASAESLEAEQVEPEAAAAEMVAEVVAEPEPVKKATRRRTKRDAA